MTSYLSRLMCVLVGSVAAVLVLLVGYGFLSAAAYLALLGVTTAPIAALVCGLVTLLFALLVALSTRWAMTGRGLHPKRGFGKNGRPLPSGEAEMAGEVGGIVGEEIASLVRAHRGAAVAVSLVAGLAVGVSPRLRQTLRDLL
jgi:hypothetical protein